jgi:hypothetical protein
MISSVFFLNLSDVPIGYPRNISSKNIPKYTLPDFVLKPLCYRLASSSTLDEILTISFF